MADESPTQFLEIDLKGLGDRLVFSKPAELRDWLEKEIAGWSWVNSAGSPQLSFYAEALQQMAREVHDGANEWNAHARDGRPLEEVFARLRRAIQSKLTGRLLLNSTSPEAKFVFSLSDSRGHEIAAGALAALLGQQLGEGRFKPAFIEGLFEGFLYKREIDWTATAHQAALNSLRQQFESVIHQQDARSDEIEKRNKDLNDSFQVLLNQRSEELAQFQSENTESLKKLRDDQTTQFQTLRDEHEKKLKAIEETYDQKLALQKPVDYWKTRENYHGVRARWFGGIALVAMLLLAGSLGTGSWFILKDVQPGENPAHWQIGALLVAIFFSIWLMRVLARLFLSHLHLATDAAERRTMILTYLAISREGAQFAPEDKTLILQNIFRTASDGLVRDDAAPPSPLEFLSRSKS